MFYKSYFVCPWRPITYQHIKTPGQITKDIKTTTDFGICMKSLCPFWEKSLDDERGTCLRAKGEEDKEKVLVHKFAI